MDLQRARKVVLDRPQIAERLGVEGEDHHAPPSNTSHLRQPHRQVAPVVNGDDRHRRIEAGIFERQRFGARLLKTRAARRQIPLSPGMARRLLALRRDSYLGPKSPVFASTGKLRTTERGELFPLSPQNFARDVLHPAGRRSDCIG
jgi:hypothetical protein